MVRREKTKKMVSNKNGKISYKMTLNVKDPVINVYKKVCNTGISKSKIKKKIC